MTYLRGKSTMGDTIGTVLTIWLKTVEPPFFRGNRRDAKNHPRKAVAELAEGAAGKAGPRPWCGHPPRKSETASAETTSGGWRR
jgi:hypothetical protein